MADESPQLSSGLVKPKKWSKIVRTALNRNRRPFFVPYVPILYHLIDLG
jgi:hypothetical protein